MRHHSLRIFVLARDCIAKGVDGNYPDRQPSLFAGSLDGRDQICGIVIPEEVKITGDQLESCCPDSEMLPLPCCAAVGQFLETFASDIDGQSARCLAVQPWLRSRHRAYEIERQK